MIPQVAWRAVRWWLALILVSCVTLVAMIMLMGQGLPRAGQFALVAVWAITFTVGMTGWVVQVFRLARRLRAAGGLLCPDCGGDLRSPAASAPETPESSEPPDTDTEPDPQCPHCRRTLTPERLQRQWRLLFHY
jgi:hypothetical protein